MSTLTFPGEMPRTIVEPAGRAKRVALHALEKPAQFRCALDRESARSDRSGRSFSLVLVRPDPAVRTGSQGWRLVKKVILRTRETDRIGWFAPGVLGVILPDTSVEGARRLLADLQPMLGDLVETSRMQVFVYPTQWPALSAADAQNRESFAATDLLPELLGHYVNGSSSPAVGTMESLLALPMPWWKRATDIAGAALGVILLSPVMLVSAAAIKLTSRGPVLFVQQRAGLAGRPFPIYKFRTMVTDAEERKHELRKHSEQDGPAFKMKSDPRVTPIGKFLRKTSIDELPQLFNVLKGHMTLVGPRPLPCPESNACARWQRRRLDVMPGLTCIWQVEGRSKVSFAEWIRMDLRYIRRRSFFQDIKLILQTVPAVLFQRGAR
jgi:lipopolysaccharide/colanic/teichoic acid biosynthesis glycosyltransferase